MKGEDLNMNKLFTKIAKLGLGLAMAAGVGVSLGSKKVTSVNAAVDLSTNEVAYEVTFEKGSNDSGTGAPTISSGTDYASIGTTTKAYKRTKGCHLGSSSAVGSQIINLTSSGTNKGQIQATYLSVYAIQVDSGKSIKTTVTYTDSTTTTNTTATGSSLAYIDIALTSTKTISSIKFESVTASRGRVAVDSFKVYKEKAGKTLSNIAVKTAPTKTTYYEGQTFVPTGLVITGTYSDASTEDISYASHSSDFTFTPSTSTALTTSNTSVTIGYGGKSTSQAITVSADVLNSVVVSGTMTTTSYTTANTWDKSGLVVTANYAGQGAVTVTSTATIAYFKDSSMTQEVAAPSDLGVGNNQTIYVKATYSGVSNTTGYSQTVSVTKAPSVQNAVFDLSAVSANNDDATISDDEVVITKGVSTVTAARGGSGNTKVSNYIGGSGTYVHTRWYNGNTITFESDGNVIKEIVVVGESGTNGPTGRMATLSSWTGASSLDSTSVSGQVTVIASANATALSYTLSGTVRLTGVTIYYYAADVAAESITINGETTSSVSITPYQETKLTASVLPLNASDRTFEWSLSPNTEDDGNQIINIDENGIVTPIEGKYGDTVVTATSNDGGFTATCTVTVERVSYHQAVYYPASTTSVTTSGTLPEGESHTFSCGSYQSGYAQLTTNNPTAELTLSGYEGQKIRSVLLKMHSNASTGTGSLSIVGGSTTIASISTATFSDESWNGEYTTDWVLIEPSCTEYDVQSGEDIVITVTATVNSLYLNEVRVQYEASEIDNTAVTFAGLILDDITCDNSGSTAPDVESWAILVEFWNDGSTITAAGKAILLEQVAVPHDTPVTDSEKLEAAMAKYDYIIGKYNKALGLTTEYPDFIGRNPSPIGGSAINLFPINKNNSNTIAIIVIISMVSVTAIGGYFFLRKRKENQ